MLNGTARYLLWTPNLQCHLLCVYSCICVNHKHWYKSQVSEKCVNHKHWCHTYICQMKSNHQHNNSVYFYRWHCVDNTLCNNISYCPVYNAAISFKTNKQTNANFFFSRDMSKMISFSFITAGGRSFGVTGWFPRQCCQWAMRYSYDHVCGPDMTM